MLSVRFWSAGVNGKPWRGYLGKDRTVIHYAAWDYSLLGILDVV